jgi:hypothetical protein
MPFLFQTISSIRLKKNEILNLLLYTCSRADVQMKDPDSYIDQLDRSIMYTKTASKVGKSLNKQTKLKRCVN